MMARQGLPRLRHVFSTGRLFLGRGVQAAAARTIAPAVLKASLPLRGAVAASVAAGVTGLAWCKPSSVLSQADKLFDANEYTQLSELLRNALSASPDDAQLLWRLARALKKLADAEGDKAAKARREPPRRGTPAYPPCPFHDRRRSSSARRTPRPSGAWRSARRTAPCTNGLPSR